MHELICDHDSSKTLATALRTCLKTINYQSTNYKCCTNGIHNYKTAHDKAICWQLNPAKNPHYNSKSKANVASITGCALCTRDHQGNKSGESTLDSGSFHHMFKDKANSIAHSRQETKIKIANGASMTELGVGPVSGSHLGAPLSLSGTLHVPDLK